MSPRHQFRMYYPEEAKKIDQGYTELGIIVVNTVSHIFRDVIVPFFIPSLKKNDNPDKDQ
jgi:hypothetical protein